nr:MAG TPA: hypothetical protein [Bacteriophage sp.]
MTKPASSPSSCVFHFSEPLKILRGLKSCQNGF